MLSAPIDDFVQSMETFKTACEVLVRCLPWVMMVGVGCAIGLVLLRAWMRRGR